MALTLEEAYSRASLPLRRKMEHSVSLLRKAEKIAKAYDAENGYFLAFSGGKDSQALYHIAELAGVQFKAHFSPTSVDPPAVIRFIRKQYPDVEFLKLKESIYSIAIRKGLLPTRRVRWCCEELKEHTGAGKVTLIGIRKAESPRRNKRNEVEINNRTFSGDMDAFEAWRKEKVTPSVANPDAVDNEAVTGCIKGKESLLVSPIIYWSDEDVWEFLNDVVRVPHCEMYDKGYKRIGCICCPMSKRIHRINDLKAFPHVRRNWIKSIKTIRGGVNCNFEALAQFDKCPTPEGADREDVIAEYILDWWLSDKSFARWYSDKFYQAKIDFPDS